MQQASSVPTEVSFDISCQICLLSPHSQYLGVLLEDLNDWTTRFLIADLLRELLCHGADRKGLFGQNAAEQTILSFPVEEVCSATWVSNVSSFFDDFDAGLQSKDRSVSAIFSQLPVAYNIQLSIHVFCPQLQINQSSS